MMNSKKPANKTTELMKLVNKLLYSVFVLQFIINISYTTLSIFWMNKNREHMSYLGLPAKLKPVGFIN